LGDARTLVRVVDELVWALRREGFDLAPAQAIQLARAVQTVGFDDMRDLREALAIVVGPPAGERARFDAVVAGFFTLTSPARASLWVRLRSEGFTEDELASLRDALQRLSLDSPSDAALAERVFAGGADLDFGVVSSGIAGAIDASSSPQLGYLLHRLLRAAGIDAARAALPALRSRLVSDVGQRGVALADALRREVDRADEFLRALVRRTHATRLAAEQRRLERGSRTAPLTSLSADDMDVVRRALREFAQRLSSARRASRHRGARGPVDPHRTLRASLRTAGVPMVLVRRRRRPPTPSFLFLCDVSESVRPVARLFLELVYLLQDSFRRARTFVFVSDIGETTRLFSREAIGDAVPLAWSGAGVVPTHENSNYGRVLRSFEQRHLPDLDRGATVVILGDGRTHGHDAAADVLARIRSRVRALIWLCPEPRGRWALGDSAMSQYATRCTAVLEVTCAEDLERAARSLFRLARGR
jgi:uncharacterized protein with von Willebrand factor type A (vWA) domain